MDTLVLQRIVPERCAGRATLCSAARTFGPVGRRTHKASLISCMNRPSELDILRTGFDLRRAAVVRLSEGEIVLSRPMKWAASCMI